MTTKLLGINSFHSNIKIKKERKKERKKKVTREMAYLEVQNERECALRRECRKYRKKKESMSVLEGAICRSRVSSLVGWGL